MAVIGFLPTIYAAAGVAGGWQWTWMATSLYTVAGPRSARENPFICGILMVSQTRSTPIP